MAVSKPRKGRSLLAFPADYTVIDIETTGLSPQLDEILEISAIRCRQYAPAESFSMLIHPKKRIPKFITELTGITNAMVKDAPDAKTVLTAFADFAQGETLMGYNVNFDINFLTAAMQAHLDRHLTNDFVDVLRLARKALPQLESRAQTAVAGYYGISAEGAHRALRDCEICNAVYLKLMQEPALAALK